MSRFLRQMSQTASLSNMTATSVCPRRSGWRGWSCRARRWRWRPRGGVDDEAQLGFLAVADRESLEEEVYQSGSSATSDGMEHKEALETSAVVSQLSDPVKAEVDNLFADGIVPSGKVIGGIFLSGDQLFGVEELSVGPSSNLVDDGGSEVEEDTSRDVLAGPSFREEIIESIITASNGLVGGHLTIRLDPVLQTEEFPACISDLNTSLTNVDGNNLSHDEAQIIYIQIRLKTINTLMWFDSPNALFQHFRKQKYQSKSSSSLRLIMTSEGPCPGREKLAQDRNGVGIRFGCISVAAQMGFYFRKIQMFYLQTKIAEKDSDLGRVTVDGYFDNIWR